MKFYLFFFLFIGPFCLFAQSDTVNVEINFAATRQALEASPHELNVGIGQSSKSEQIINLPYQNGILKAFKLIEYDILPEQLRKEIKTFYGHMIEDPSVTCRLTLANGQISVSMLNSTEMLIIEKNKLSSSLDSYLLYKADQSVPFCGLESLGQKTEKESFDQNAIMFTSHGTQLRTYRLALLVTNAFYTARGNNDAAVNTDVATIVNNINGLFEKEIAVRFTLISPNNPASANVFYNYSGSTSLSSIATENNTRFGNANFDVGHCLEASGGGVASLGVVCSTSGKGRGLSGVSSVSSIFIFAHELGHQFNAGHTFNGNGSGNCGPDNRMNNDAYEPGSGNTIMSYEGLCSPGSFNITGGEVPYFHTRSQTTMIQHITTRPVGCGVVVNTGNSAPVVSVTSTINIPKNTPFALTGSATDANADPLTYTWEQYNLAAISDSGSLGNTANALGISAVNSTSAPLFRTWQGLSGTRNFPSLQYVISNSNNPPDNAGEDLPNVARTMNFRLTARDNKVGGGGVGFAEVAVVVANEGPFEVTAGNGPTLWFVGESKPITWSVNGTNGGVINCANVKISTSTDGGATFTTLIASTPNDGSHPFIVPSTPTNQFRIKVEAVGNVFFDINNVDITISSGACVAESSVINQAQNLNSFVGASNLELNLSALGAVLNSFSGSITSTDPGSNLAFSQNGACSGPSNSNRYDSYRFQVVTSGTYTFSFTGTGSLIMNLYQNGFFAGNVCANWLASSGSRSAPSGPVSLSNNLTASLTPGIYEIVMSTFSNGVSLPAAYNISKTGSAIYDFVPSEGSPYDYTFLAVNTLDNQIKLFENLADLRSLTASSYEVYGLSFAGGADLTPFLNTSFSNFQAAINSSTFCAKLSSNFKPVTISVCPSIPNAPIVSPITIFQDETASLTATGCSGTYNWFETASSSAVLSTSATFVTPPLTQTRSYFVSCIETCESSRASVLVTVQSYCTTTPVNCNAGDRITKVALRRNMADFFTQTSLICESNTGYTFYNAAPPSIIQGETIGVEVTKNTDYPAGLSVWIDFNRNAVFELSERVLSATNNSTATQFASFTVPTNAIANSVRMRVKIDYDTNTTDPCIAQDTDPSGPFGEVEDYLINITSSCENEITLLAPTNNISSGTSIIRSNNNAAASNQGRITATNKITGGNTTYSAGKKVELLQGFEASGAATVFKAEIGGCSN